MKFSSLFSSRSALSQQLKTKLTIKQLAKFHSSLYIQGQFSWRLPKSVRLRAIRAEGPVLAPPFFQVSPVEASSPWQKVGFEFQVQLQRAEFPHELVLVFELEEVGPVKFKMEQVRAAITPAEPRLYDKFCDTLREEPGYKKMIDVGGRARSGYLRKTNFPQMETVTFDVLADEGVDVVGDAHELSSFFAKDSFDAVCSYAVFEHLIMPWKAAVEINRVLRPGGLVFVDTHQTMGVHDAPWDYLRFSDMAWKGIFNAYTGFEILETEMTRRMYILPHVWDEQHAPAEAIRGFEVSAVLARKVGEAKVDWPVKASEITKDLYPQ